MSRGRRISSIIISTDSLFSFFFVDETDHEDYISNLVRCWNYGKRTAVPRVHFVLFIYTTLYSFWFSVTTCNRSAGPMARRLTTNQEIAGSIPASIKKISPHFEMSLFCPSSILRNRLPPRKPRGAGSFCRRTNSGTTKFCLFCNCPELCFQAEKHQHNQHRFSAIEAKLTTRSEQNCSRMS
jgi:hypothetical protein